MTNEATNSTPPVSAANPMTTHPTQERIAEIREIHEAAVTIATDAGRQPTILQRVVTDLLLALDAAQEENARLRKVLEFYANPVPDEDGSGIPDFYDELDFGARAQAALKEPA